MRRCIFAIGILLAMGFTGVGLSEPRSVLAAGGGNADAAHACQYNGYLGLIGTDGVSDHTFLNAGECASYAANGGTLVSSSAAGPCLNGGYAGLTTAGGSEPFPTEAACVLYVGQGGTPVPVSSTWFSVTVGPGVTGSYCTLTFTGAGLAPGSQPTYQFAGSDNTINLPNGAILTVAPDGTLNDQTHFRNAYTFVFTAQTASGGTLTQTVTYNSNQC